MKLLITRNHFVMPVLSLILSISALSCAGLAVAQSKADEKFPTRPISLIVPFAAGGPTDIVARLIAVPMGKSLGETIIVENVLGAGGTVAANKVAKAKPDGYTLFIYHIGMATAPALNDKLAYDPMKDFEYIGQVVDVPMVLLARKDFPPNNLKELIAYLKKNEKKVTMANAGPGAVSQLCGLVFMDAIGVKLTTIPYKGTGPAFNDLLGGQVDLLCDQTTQTLPFIKSDKVKTYGVTTPKRLPSIPNIPTLDEGGLKGFDVKVWHGIYAPKGTPAPILKKINTALKLALSDPTIKARMDESSIDIVPMAKVSEQGLKDHLEKEINRWGPLIRKANIPD